MLNEDIADQNLEKVMKMAADDVLKAKTSEEKEATLKRYENLSRIYNDRLKIIKEHTAAESKLLLESERIDNDKAFQLQEVIDNDRSRKKDMWVRVGIKAAELSIVGAGLFIQCLMMHNNMIETDAISKGTTKSIIGKFGDYLRG